MLEKLRDNNVNKTPSGATFDDIDIDRNEMTWTPDKLLQNKKKLEAENEQSTSSGSGEKNKQFKNLLDIKP